MAAVAATPSPRDHDADDNPNLARKRQRLSEDPALSPGSSVLIEVCDTEEMGTDPAHSIVIDPDFDRYSDAFIRDDVVQPKKYLDELREQLERDCHIDPRGFLWFADALEAHIKQTDDDSSAWRLQYLEREPHFFASVANFALCFLESRDHFEPVIDLRLQAMQDAFRRLMLSMLTLCLRILPLLPEAVNTVLSRRDSALGSNPRLSVQSLRYIVLTERALDQLSPATFQFLRKASSLKLHQTLAVARTSFADPDICRSLAEVIRGISGSMREVKDSWFVLGSALAMFRISIDRHWASDDFPLLEIETVMDTIHNVLVPTVRGKHPRALPHGFHENITQHGEQILLFLASHSSSLDEPYGRFVKSSTDALFGNMSEDESTSACLQRMSGSSNEIGTQLLALSWALQTTKSLIASDIMDVRWTGITLLNQRLIEIRAQIETDKIGLDHPLVQYVIRFLRQNGMIGYIFGPESHAGLIEASKDVSAFLAATKSHTPLETDLIWQTCTTSVEADFVKAALAVLIHIAKWLPFDQMLYVVSKYNETPVDRLSTHAVEALPTLLRTLEEQASKHDVEIRREMVALTNIKLLDHAYVGQQTLLTGRLYQCALTRIRRLTEPYIQPHERVKILQPCITKIRSSGQDSTAAIQVLKEFIRPSTLAEEARSILELVDPADLIMDLHSYVRPDTGRGPDSRGIMLRLHCIVALTWLSETPAEESTLSALMKSVFGNEGLSISIRDAAWDKLFRLSSEAGFPSAATPLWSRLMEDHVPLLPAHLATEQLVRFIDTGLRQNLASEEVTSDFPALFECALWKTLIRFATCSIQPEVSSAASKIVLDFLFRSHKEFKFSPEVFAQCQRQFVRDRVVHLHRIYEEAAARQGEADFTECLRSIDLLHDTLRASKNSAPFVQDVVGSYPLEIDDAGKASDRFSFDATIYGAEHKPVVMHVIARSSTRVTTLLDRLPTYTGAVRNKIFANGVDITDASDDTIANVIGICHAGALLVRPRFAIGDDIDLAFAPAGTVEQEILAHYDSIEALLDGPENIAERAYRFLRQVSLPHAVRQTVSSAGLDVDKVFPVQRPYRTRFSLFVLEQQSSHFARLGVVDAAFSRRVLRLLADILMDSDRQYGPNALHEILTTLVIYLRGITTRAQTVSTSRAESLPERPSEGHLQPLFPDSEAFASRLLTLLSETRTLSGDSDTIRTPHHTITLHNALADVCHHTIFQACESDDEFWGVIRSRKGDIIEAHKWLLLDKDPALSALIATRISSLCRFSDPLFDFPNFFWQTLAACLGDALSRSSPQSNFFIIAHDVLELDRTTKDDAEASRRLVAHLFSELDHYRHRESPTLLIPDYSMEGLLRLLISAVQSSMNLHGELTINHDLSNHLQKLLFTSLDSDHGGPLVAESTRRIAYELVKVAYTARSYIDLLNSVNGAVASAPRCAGDQFPGLLEWARPAHQGAGLSNLGMTCYMNSLLQQLFANLQFRKFIVDQPIENFPRQEVLANLQQLFTRMQQSTIPTTRTDHLASVLGVQVGSQEDVHTFYTTLLSRLEECMPTAQQKFALMKFFTGKSVTQIRGECGHVSARSEAFTELSITVRNKANLHESLDEFVQGEPLEGANKYKCMTCMEDGKGKLVNAMRRTCLEDIPDSLTFCMKRFSFDNFLDGENKVNDRFDFPPEIDMSRYKRDHLESPGAAHESDIFELVGVIVHQGSLSFGHYWSYVRVPEPPGSAAYTWLYIEDEKAFVCANGLNDVLQQCSGGLYWQDGSERPDSAYVLFYQRKRYAAEALSFNVIPESAEKEARILPRVKLPTILATDVNRDNTYRAKVASLFSHDFSSFIFWVLDGFSDAIITFEDAVSADSSDTDIDTSSVYNDLEAKVAHLIVGFATRIFLVHPEAVSRLSELKLRVAVLLKARPTIAAHVLGLFAGDDFQFLFDSIIKTRVSAAGAAVMEIIFQCLKCVREHEREEIYQQIVHSFFRKYSEMLGYMQTRWNCWKYCFVFASNFAKLGPFETEIVLETQCLMRVLELLHLPWNGSLRKYHQTLCNAIRAREADCAPLFDFLYDLLSGHVDISVDIDTIDSAGGDRLPSDTGWCLTNYEVNMLFKTSSLPKICPQKLWTLLLSGKFSTTPSNWQDYAPGKLLALLSNTTNEYLRNLVVQNLHNHVDGEEEHIQSLLHLFLHFCLARPEEECRPLLFTLGKTLHLWHGENMTCLKFFSHAVALRPIAVLANIQCWVTGVPDTRAFLCAKTARVRIATAEWLRDHLFKPHPVSEEPSVDAVRIRTTRGLVKHCDALLRSAYAREAERKPYEAMISTTANAKEYLLRLQESVKTIDAVSREVHLEADEARTTLTILKDLEVFVDDWMKDDGVSGSALPTRVKGFTGTDLEGEEEDEESEDDDATAALEEDDDEDLYS